MAYTRKTVTAEEKREYEHSPVTDIDILVVTILISASAMFTRSVRDQ